VKPSRLAVRSLTHYWRTNAAVVAGVAVAVTVLSGALLVGDSVRGTLRDLVLQRLGATDLAVVSTDFFRSRLADDLRDDASFNGIFRDACPLITVQGVAVEQRTGKRSSRVQVYGVDDRFWRFHRIDRVRGPAARDVLVSAALARDLGAGAGATLLLRVQRPSAIPLESLHARKDDLGRTLRLTVRAVLPSSDLGEFSLQPQQGAVRAVFVPLRRLQQDLELGDRVNALLVSSKSDRRTGVDQLEALIRRHAALEDLGMDLRVLERQHLLALESNGTLVDDRRAGAATAVAQELGFQTSPVLTYLANAIRIGDRQIPYSLVTATELAAMVPDVESEEASAPPIVLNDWAARNLDARIGDRVVLEYYVWEDPGRLATQTADFLLAGVVPLAGTAADRDFAPVYPGITDSDRVRDWNPPFPIDLGRVRPIDEDYWRAYRTTPKAFVPLAIGQALWRSRYGSLTSIRIVPPQGIPLAQARDQYGARLREAVDPLAMGLAVRDVRADGLAASRGATDFGEYFTYFSFFLVASAVMLAALFFKLGVEQRAREIGLLRAVGFNAPLVRRLFTGEALVLAVLGSGLGVAGAVAYGQLMMTALSTWWIGAVGTTALALHVSAASLLAGAAGGVLAALVWIWWTLRALASVSERGLLAGYLTGEQAGEKVPSGTRRVWLGPRAGALGFLACGVLLLLLALAGWIDRTGAFFGAGASLLASCLCVVTLWLRRPSPGLLAGHGWWPISRLGLRNAAYRPGRSVLSIAVVASATFILISVDAFRLTDRPEPSDPHSGTGGYRLLVDTVLPIARDPNSAEGRTLLGLASTSGVTITPFRVLPGDDASCLNLYEPRQPRILAAPPDFIAQGRFAFESSLDRSDEERANPWLLLTRQPRDDAIPVIADANSMTYVLHRKLGDEIVISHNGRPVRLRLVAALADSIFQAELLMSEANFRAVFPEQEGYRFLLVAAPTGRVDQVAAAIEDRLSDFGADAVPAAARLAEFHQVENTYLSTFQTLGGLGLLLGTIGLAAVLLRNVLERRRELALLGAVGYGRGRLFVIVIAESALLLVCGLVIGTVCALVSIAPAVIDRGGHLPTAAGAWLVLFGVFGTGLVSSIVATRAAIRSRLLDALAAE
jgi:ABC-type lipoprotein release transport system permease subunit